MVDLSLKKKKKKKKVRSDSVSLHCVQAEAFLAGSRQQAAGTDMSHVSAVAGPCVYMRVHHAPALPMLITPARPNQQLDRSSAPPQETLGASVPLPSHPIHTHASLAGPLPAQVTNPCCNQPATSHTAVQAQTHTSVLPPRCCCTAPTGPQGRV